MRVLFSSSPRLPWLLLIGLAVGLRLGVMLAGPERLTQDRDLYLGIANEMRAGHGYATPGSDPPQATAFRPPLYPLILSLTGGSRVGIAVLHLLLAGVMVVATGVVAERMVGRSRCCGLSAGLLAGGIVAVDPLLLLYSGQPMTETLCSCLSAVLLWWVASKNIGMCGLKPTLRTLAPVDEVHGSMVVDRGLERVELPPHPSPLPHGEVISESQTHCGGEGAGGRKYAVVEGVLWGLCLLARPTYAVALGLWLMGRVLLGVRKSGAALPGLRCGLLVGVVALAVVSPWAIRNWVVFGRPIVTTTHGGYTLWLANNPVYYSEVIEGTDAVWNGESLNRWQYATDVEMDRIQVHGEVARDRWLSQHAKEFIQANPQRFARACLHRGLAFWAIWPGRAGDSGVPLAIQWLIAGGYAALWIGGVVTAFRLVRSGEWQRLLPAFCLIVGFFAVHLVYWTDGRMRAPIIPAVALLVAVGFSQKNRCVSVKPSDASEG